MEPRCNRVDRRTVLTGAMGWLLVAFSPKAIGQRARGGIPRVAVLAPSTREREEVTLRPFFDEMRRLNWIEGETIHYDRAYGDDIRDNLTRLARELVARKPDLIFAPPSPAAVAARDATRIIPIVFATGTDPVGSGLVESLARPGGNVTGALSVVESLAPKVLEIFHEIVPTAKRIGYINDAKDPRARIDVAALSPIAAARGLVLLTADVTRPEDLKGAVARLVDQRVDAIATGTSLIFNLRIALLELTNARGVPVVGHRTELAEAGALITYGANLPEQMRRAAFLADKVLKGSSPSEMPVEQPTRFELIVNMKTARRFGLTVPQSVLLRADRVIE